MMDKEKVGAFIRKLRTEKGYTQQELSDKLHVTNKAVSRWETGHNFPDISLFNEISAVLDISVVELMNGEANGNRVYQQQEAEELLVQVIEEVKEHDKAHLRKLFLGLFIVCIIACVAITAVTIFYIHVFYILQAEKNLEEAATTFAFIILAMFLLLINYGLPVFGISLSGIMILKAKRKIIKILFIILEISFIIWLLCSVGKVLL